MQTASSANGFLRRIEACRLLSRQQLAPFEAGTESPVESATALIRAGLLTPYQAKLLLKGQAPTFFLTEKYKLLDLLGSGGMGKVYLCEHLILHRLVAVKVLTLKAAPDSAARQGVIERFYREARAVAALDHRNIVRMFDADQTRGIPFMVMEYVDGVDLHKLVIENGPLEPGRAADFIRQAAEGLQHAHEAGLIHRDIKPSNLLLDRMGVVKLLDLGLARFRGACGKDSVTAVYDTNAVLGTADFMAPEQAIDSSAVDIRADIYSLGCTLYFLLSGRNVFEEGSLPQKMLAHQMKTPTPLRSLRPEIPEGLESVVGRMMAKNPAFRYQTPREVVEALQFLAEPPVPPAEHLLPKVGAHSFRLGLCPVPNLSSGYMVVPLPSASLPAAAPSGFDTPRAPILATEVSLTDTTPDNSPAMIGAIPGYPAGPCRRRSSESMTEWRTFSSVKLVLVAVLGFAAITLITIVLVRAMMAVMGSESEDVNVPAPVAPVRSGGGRIPGR
jgi:serine/threonine protein kinase